MARSASLSRTNVKRLAVSHYSAALTQAASGQDGTKHLVQLAIKDLRLGSAPSSRELDCLLSVYLDELDKLFRNKQRSYGAGPFWIGFTCEMLGYTCIALACLMIWIAGRR